MIHLYTGEGKGKTTAALGLAVRAAGRGRRVAIVQFCKGRETGELASLARLPGVAVFRNRENYGFYTSLPEETKRQVAAENSENLRAALAGKPELLVLDEACGAWNFGALDRDAVESLLKDCPGEMEIVLTGRGAPELFAEAADYITEMRKLRHPYDGGTEAREGVEY